MNTYTHTPAAPPAAADTRRSASRLVGALGFIIPLTSYYGLHELHPEGAVESMTDAEIAAWAESGAHQIWSGGVLELLVALLLLVFGAGLVERLTEWGASPWTRRVTMGSIQVVAAVVALTGLLQVMAGVLGTPEEAYESPTLLVASVLLYGNLNVAAWCLLAPAAAAVTMTPGAPRWLRVGSGILAALLLVSLALPFVSWGPGFLWMMLTGVALGFRRRSSGD